jgi:hypothetical protein
MKCRCGKYRAPSARLKWWLAHYAAIIFVAFAPFFCLRYCEVRHAVLGQNHTAAAVEIAHHHPLDEPSSQPTQPGSKTNTQQSFPLDELKQMLSSFTDILPASATIAIALLAVLLRVWMATLPHPHKPPVPTPPPRFAHF